LDEKGNALSAVMADACCDINTLAALQINAEMYICGIFLNSADSLIATYVAALLGVSDFVSRLALLYYSNCSPIDALCYELTDAHDGLHRTAICNSIMCSLNSRDESGQYDITH
jgi:hypothetical protein